MATGGIFGALKLVSQQLTITAAIFSHSMLYGPQAQAVRSMSKMKTHKGASKRWKAIAKGMFQRKQTGLRHINRKLAPDTRRHKWHLDRLLPYAKH
ncbi:hypothetical protein BX070DRAFT_230162 [Coemansia spiralis]|nr:hypothetical protein BX070DRAFT_230162 [Coemansia spiralis]